MGNHMVWREIQNKAKNNVDKSACKQHGFEKITRLHIAPPALVCYLSMIYSFFFGQCTCKKDTVKICMDVFVKTYQVKLEVIKQLIFAYFIYCQ